MDRGKRAINRNFGNMNNNMYLDLKDIIQKYAIPFCPAKSLFRFMGVCKDWKNQISTPFFAHNQSNSFNTASGVFSQSAGNHTSFISLDYNSYGVPDPSLKFLPEKFDIRSSSNGLVCCQGRSGDKAYYICNPVTKQYKKLPKPSVNHGDDPAIVLVFNPSRLNFLAEYKLICAFESVGMDNGHEFEIYSSSRDSWDVSGEIIFGNWKVISKSGVHVNGVLYWQIRSGILAFDLLKERAQVIPNWDYQMKDSSSMGAVDGRLGAFTLSNQTLSVQVLSNIHTNTMGSFGKTSTTGAMSLTNKTWEKKYKIPLDSSFVPGFSFHAASIVFGGSEAAVILSGKTMISYDLKTKEAVVLSSDVESGSRFTPYVNSLVYL